MKRTHPIWALPLALSVLLGTGYVVYALLLVRAGFHSDEALFFTEKSLITLYGQGNRLTTFGTTFPLVPFFAQLPLALVSPLLAPHMASAVGTAAVFFLMAYHWYKKTGQLWLVLLLAVLFVAHPGLLYMAVSGRSTYLTTLLFYGFCMNLMGYYQRELAFYVAAASILLAMLIFTNFQFVWFAGLLLPLVWLMSLPHTRSERLLQTIRIIMHRKAVRSIWISKSLALTVLLYFFPVVMVGGYLWLNQLLADDPLFFLKSPYANWRVAYLAVAPTEAPQPYWLLLLLTVVPSVLGALARQTRFLRLFLYTTVAWLLTLSFRLATGLFAIEYYLTLLIPFVVGVLLLRHRLLLKRRHRLGLVALTLLQAVVGFLYVSTSTIPSERLFWRALTSQPFDTFAEQRALAAYIRHHIPAGEVILTDDAYAYQLVALNGQVGRFLLPYRSDYLMAIQAPENVATYALLPNASLRDGRVVGQNVLYQYFADGKSRQQLQEIYLTKRWKLVKFSG